MRYTIGELAARTGLTVKAIRLYSNRGIVPPAGRSPAGYRLYGPEAVARLRLVRTLRELGLDLATIREVVNGEADLRQIAAAHAQALAAQIRILRVRRAVLTAIARHGSTPDELDVLMHDERRRLIDDFLDHVFGDSHPGVRRSMTPQLPDDPSPEQVRAWNELAELVADQDFRDAIGRMTARPDYSPTVLAKAGRAMAAGLEPAQAADVVAGCGVDDLLSWLADVADPRRQRYLERLATVNGWAAPPDVRPLAEWTARVVALTR